MQINSMQDLYETKLQSIADAEKLALNAYPTLLREVHNEQLHQALDTHMQQSQRHLEQVKQLLPQGGQKPQQQTSVPMQALIHAVQHTLSQIRDADVKDAFLIGATRAMEHQEIASYSTALAWARGLGHEHDARLLESILNEEKQTDEKLAKIARQSFSQPAARSDREVPLGTRSETGRAQTSRSRSPSQSPTKSPSRSQPGARASSKERDIDDIEDMDDIDRDAEL